MDARRAAFNFAQQTLERIEEFTIASLGDDIPVAYFQRLEQAQEALEAAMATLTTLTTA